jgi:hypothetical protein
VKNDSDEGFSTTDTATPNEMIIYLMVETNIQGNMYIFSLVIKNNTQGNGSFPWLFTITLKEICHFLGGNWKPSRKHPYFLAVYFNLQGIYVSLRV